MALRTVEVYARANPSWKEVVCWPSLPAPMFAPAVVMAPLVPSIVTQTAEFIDADFRWKAKEFSESVT